MLGALITRRIDMSDIEIDMAARFLDRAVRNDRPSGTPADCTPPMVDAATALSSLKWHMAEDAPPNVGGSYARSWHDSLACCAMDEGVPNEAANKIAARFMKMTFDVTTQ